MPSDWLKLTTHRLDIYDEKQAKEAFLEEFNKLYEASDSSTEGLAILPTAFDYIRLGHPLSSILEWAIAQSLHISPSHVISFSSKIAPVLAILRNNLLDKKATRIVYCDQLPACFDAEVLREIYSYNFELIHVSHWNQDESFEGATVYVKVGEEIIDSDKGLAADFIV